GGDAAARAGQDGDDDLTGMVHRATPKARCDAPPAGAGRPPAITRTASTTLAARISPPVRRWATGSASMVSCPPGIQTAEKRARYAPTPSTSCTAKRISSVRAAGL